MSKIICSGQLKATYKDGYLCDISYADIPVIDRLYIAVRDQFWNTIPGKIEHLKIKESDIGFEISFVSHHAENEVNFQYECQCSYHGSDLLFEVKGEALSGFMKNRIGICIHHPVEISDLPVQIKHIDHQISIGKFPVLISPHQPFKDISEISYIQNSLNIHFLFDGDIFEMEDHRNWMDFSFKTYSTPLENPFPVHVSKGEKINQKIRISLTDHAGLNRIPNQVRPELKVKKDIKYKLPAIGLEANTFELSNSETSLLRNVDLSFVRVEVRFDQPSWQQDMISRINQANALFVPIELIVFLDQPRIEELKEIQRLAKSISNITIIDPKAVCTSSQFIQRHIEDFRLIFQNIPVGSGTNHYFTELNRSPISSDQLDYLSFSLNPQVHGFDDSTLINNLQTISHISRTAKKLTKTNNIAISPITLKPRFNPNALAKGKLAADPRQKTQFNALWTLGCIKHIAQNSIFSAAFYETIGDFGIMKKGTLDRDNVFPVYQVFELISKFRNHSVVHTESSHPQKFEGLIFETRNSIELILANFCNTDQTITVLDHNYTLTPCSIYSTQL